MKRFVRFTTFGLILLAVASLILAMIGKFEQYVNGYVVLLEASLLGSWVCLTWYVYGIRVMYSEKALAIARHPWFLFDRERLKRYLEANRKEER